LHQQFRARIASRAINAAAAAVFVSGFAVSAFGQTTPTTPQAPGKQPQVAQLPAQPGSVANGTPVSMDEAVRMALENNLGIQAERLNPELQSWAVIRANAFYAPNLVSTVSKANNASPPSDFTSAGVSVVTNGNFTTQGGLQQQLRWGGGGYRFTMDGQRGTTNAPNNPFPKSLSSHFTVDLTQPLLRNFAIDSSRQQLEASKIQQTITDLGLQARITQTTYGVKAAYSNLEGSIASLQVAQESLDVARQSLKDDQARVAVGTAAKIDTITSEAEVASNEEAVIIGQAAIESAQDQLRALVMNPSQAGFWTTAFVPSDKPTVTDRTIDVDAAVKNALEHRTDLQQFKKNMDITDVTVKYAQNQKMPGIDLNAHYGLIGVGGTELQYATDPATGLYLPTGSTVDRGFGSVLSDVFGNTIRSWSVGVNVSYPIGTSSADALLAQSRLQQKQNQTNLASLELGIATQVRQAARLVTADRKRVETTGRARELAQERLDAENRRFEVGLSSTFEKISAQRDLSSAKRAETQAVLEYNLALAAFEAIQTSPLQ
jgi:outer membrane protein TolC